MGAIGFVLPSFNHFDYVLATARSFFDHTPNGMLFVVDDGSREWTEQVEADLMAINRERTVIARFPTNNGLTRSWNYGLRQAREYDCEFAVAGNSDVLFTPGWYDELIAALDDGGYAMSGPLSNCPGVTARGLQEVKLYLPDYRVTDDEAAIRQTAAQLKAERAGQFVDTVWGVNGFFLFSRVKTWFEGMFDKEHVFNPKYALVKNEDEIQGRWRANGRLSGIALGSFIFHYRSVSRHQMHRRPGWFRRS